MSNDFAYESEAVDRAIYGGNLNVGDFQTAEQRTGLIVALLDQWGLSLDDQNKLETAILQVLERYG